MRWKFTKKHKKALKICLIVCLAICLGALMRLYAERHAPENFRQERPCGIAQSWIQGFVMTPGFRLSHSHTVGNRLIVH